MCLLSWATYQETQKAGKVTHIMVKHLVKVAKNNLKTRNLLNKLVKLDDKILKENFRSVKYELAPARYTCDNYTRK